MGGQADGCRCAKGDETSAVLVAGCLQSNKTVCARGCRAAVTPASPNRILKNTDPADTAMSNYHVTDPAAEMD